MVTTEVFDKNQSSWDKIKEAIVYLENEAFPEHPFGENELEKDFLNPENLVVLLKNTDNQEVIGFSYAKPIATETTDDHAQTAETAIVWDTIINKEYRGKGYLGVIMDKLEEELKNRGFKYIERYSLLANNFAENIAKHYKDRILESYPTESQWGPQIFFRIKL